MCSRHAEPGAGQPDIFDDVADYLVASSYVEALKDDACALCHGSGEMMGGDEYQPCPKCKGAA